MENIILNYTPKQSVPIGDLVVVSISDPEYKIVTLNDGSKIGLKEDGELMNLDGAIPDYILVLNPDVISKKIDEFKAQKRF